MSVKIHARWIFILLSVVVQYNVICAKRILVVTNIQSYSHQINYRALCLELNRRGHEIVSVTTDPIRNSSLANYTEIDLQYFYRGIPKYRQFKYTSITEASLHMSLLELQKYIWDIYHVNNREVFEHPELKKLYAPDSNEHFDAVIIGIGPHCAINALAHRFNAPLIGMSTLDVFNHMRYTFGSMILPSHVSNWESNTLMEDSASFWKRLVNFCEVWLHMYYWVNVYVPREDALAKEFLGEHLPYIDEITKNMSIYLANRHPVITFVRPEQPNVIFYNGFNIKKVPPVLSKDLKQTLDDTTEGFVYVSLGSNVQWELLSNNTFEAFVEGLSALPYKVLWKYPSKVAEKYKNIITFTWLPQQSVLAHPNIKLFVYQGGLQSTEEAIYYGVPLVGYPMFWDQDYQIRKMVELGVCVHLKHDPISKEKVESAVLEVANNRRYRDRMKELSELYKDMPYDTLQNAAWWVEHVMRHNGSPHLRYSLADKLWYERYDWDIIGFLAVVAFAASLISLYALWQILRFVCRYYRTLYYPPRDYHRVKSKSQ